MQNYWQRQLYLKHGRKGAIPGKEGLRQYFIFLNGKLLTSVWTKDYDEALKAAKELDPNATVG